MIIWCERFGEFITAGLLERNTFSFIHLVMAVVAIVIGEQSGCHQRHAAAQKLGWGLMGLMAFVTLSSLFIRDLNDGSFS